MNVTPIAFHSEEYRLVGDLYAPDDLQPGERRAGIVLCHGYTGVKDLYVPDNARVLTEAGYIVLAFDYKGWGESEGPRTRLAPYSRVADVQAPSPSSERRMRWTHPGSTSEESRALCDKAGEPKKLVVLEGYGHYEVYAEPAFGEVMREAVAWFREHLAPA